MLPRHQMRSAARMNHLLWRMRKADAMRAWQPMMCARHHAAEMRWLRSSVLHVHFMMGMMLFFLVAPTHLGISIALGRLSPARTLAISFSIFALSRLFLLSRFAISGTLSLLQFLSFLFFSSGGAIARLVIIRLCLASFGHNMAVDRLVESPLQAAQANRRDRFIFGPSGGRLKQSRSQA